MPTSFNTQPKQAIRKNWVTPLISFVRNNLDKKLFYLGLPSDEALDIKEWLDHLDIVYAFQCRDYPKPSDDLQSRERVLKLEGLLREYERKKQLQTFEVFDGYLEEVVLRGYDNSPTPKDFLQSDVVTVYNLDYCNSITSPIEFVDKSGTVQNAYKFDAINVLMRKQADLPFHQKKFLLFLTVHCSYNDKQTQKFKTNPPNGDIAGYFKGINRLSKKEQAPFILKAFVHDNLSKFFATNNFIAEFFPVIYYEGNGGNPLLFFTVVGTQIKNTAGTPSPTPVISEFLRRKFFSVEADDTFSNNSALLANRETDWLNTDSINLFRNSTSVQEHWGK